MNQLRRDVGWECMYSSKLLGYTVSKPRAPSRFCAYAATHGGEDLRVRGPLHQPLTRTHAGGPWPYSFTNLSR
jgi:hypothetical protein